MSGGVATLRAVNKTLICLGSDTIWFPTLPLFRIPIRENESTQKQKDFLFPRSPKKSTYCWLKNFFAPNLPELASSSHRGKNVETGNELYERRRCRKAPKLISLSDCCNRFSSPSLLCVSPLLSVLRLANVVVVVWCVVVTVVALFFCFQHQVLIMAFPCWTYKLPELCHTHIVFLLNVKRLAGDSTFCKSLAIEFANPKNIFYEKVKDFCASLCSEKNWWKTIKSTGLIYHIVGL